MDQSNAAQEYASELGFSDSRLVMEILSHHEVRRLLVKAFEAGRAKGRAEGLANDGRNPED